MKRSRVGMCALICLALCGSPLVAKKTDKELKAMNKVRETEEKARKKIEAARMKAEESRMKAEKKAKAVRIKAEQKAVEEREKAEKKVVEEHMKAEQKAAEEREKAEKKLAMERERTAKKDAEAREKERKKALAARKKAAEEARKQMESDRKAEESARIKAAKERENARIKAENEAKAAEKRRIRQARRDEEERSGKWDFLYKLPAWPFSSEYANKKDILNFYGQYQYATKAYSSSDHSQDLSKLVFGEKAIRLQDILLVSKLMRAGKVESSNGVTSDNYLYTFANDTISFDADFEEFIGSFGYSRTFHKNVSFGFDIPVAHREHELKLRTHVSDANQEKLTESSKFPARFNQSFETFIREILKDKNINLIQKNTVSGLGDITAFVNLDIPTKHLEKLEIGARIKFATARDRDLGKLWDAELGNGGFTELSAFTGFLYSKKRYLNPHIFLQGTYGLSAYVDRRVPRRRTYNGTDKQQQILGASQVSGLEGITFDDQAKFKLNTPFSEDDTTFRRFATETKRIKIHRGPEIQFRIGNIFEDFILRRGFLDIFYDLRAKGRDYIGSRLDRDTWNPSVLVHNSYHVSHRVGFNASYQFDEHFRTEFGGLYAFAGRNFAEVWELNSAIKWEF